MYSLISENLTHLGGPMGSEYIYPNWTKYFETEEKAKEFAEEDYRKHNKIKEKVKIEWKKESNGKIRSPDLSYVMYHIKKVKVEQ